MSNGNPIAVRGKTAPSACSPGDWRELLRESVGEDVSARAMVVYFAPLMDWWVTQSQGRIYTLRERPTL